MTIAEMHLAFNLGADSVATLGYPGAEPEEKDFFLNRAIERFVKTRYSGNNPGRKAVEESQKRIDDLRTLVLKNATSHTNVLQIASNEWVYPLPQTGGTDRPYLLLLGSNIKIDRDNCGVLVAPPYRKIRTKQVTHDQLETFLDDPYHVPDYDECFIITEGQDLHIFTNGSYNVKEVNITYLTYPDKVSLSTPTNCNLPAHTHQEIVDLAVRLYVGSIGDTNKLQSETSIITEQE